MTISKQHGLRTAGTSLRVSTFALAVAIAFVLAVAATPAAQAQTFQVIHHFTGGADGATPQDGLAIDRAGNLYGVTEYGGQQSMCPSAGHAAGCGALFRLKFSGSGWTLTPLYNFLNNDADGRWPYGRLVFGPDGALYGTTTTGGPNHGGTVFRLAPSGTACKTALCPWTETVLYSFTADDGLQPFDIGGLAFDPAGNLYGTTVYGGSSGRGVVFKLAHTSGSWTEGVLYSFATIEGGVGPAGGVILDQAGNLYGTVASCDPNCSGSVFQLTPSRSGWTQNVIHSFDGDDGEDPMAGLIMDGSGSLYGSTVSGQYGGTVFQLTPASGSWIFSFTWVTEFQLGPEGNLVMDNAGNLYGTTYSGGAHAYGNVFELVPGPSGWAYTSLYDFVGGDGGQNPQCNLVFDDKGNLYGTTTKGGQYGYGTVFEITP